MPTINYNIHPWTGTARKEMNEHEIAGSRDNPQIQRYLATCGLKGYSDETPWCAAFVNWCLKKSGKPHIDSAVAAHWSTYGSALHVPTFGAIVVLGKGGFDHVAFFIKQSGSWITLLGGNQHDMVKESNFPRASVSAIRWPPGAPRRHHC